MDVSFVWSEIKNNVRNKIGRDNIENWFGPVTAEFEQPNTIILKTPDLFFQGWFRKNYLSVVVDAARAIIPDIQIKLTVSPKVKAPSQSKKANNLKLENSGLSSNLQHINQRYSFENFVVGPSNRFAHAAALAIVDAPAKAYNPLSIYGGVGLGKTHLMQAICLALYKKDSRLKIFYTTSERFTNELINAIQHHSTSGFRAKYRNVDILLVDDIQFIAGKESTQEEFFHTFNALYDTHKQIIISSDRPSQEITNLQERLSSRFSWGLITDIQPPDFETRMAILKKKLEHEQVNVPDNVIYFIADKIKTNIRELEGALIRVVAYSLLEEKEVSLDLTKYVLKDMLRETKKTITRELIQHSVADHFNLRISDLKNKKRSKNLIFPRQVAMYLTRKLTNLSFPDIGEAFGGKDHTTVLYAYKKIDEQSKKNKDVSDIVNKLTTDIML
ncbi:MAG: chromosomal replication initiator protein DnaA [Candidatus Omnitrophota bacterium]